MEVCWYIDFVEVDEYTYCYHAPWCGVQYIGHVIVTMLLPIRPNTWEIVLLIHGDTYCYRTPTSRAQYNRHDVVDLTLTTILSICRVLIVSEN